MKILYVNHGLAQNCGVYDFGVRHYNAIKNNNTYTVFYVECDTADSYLREYDYINPDVVFYNYAPVVMGWLNKTVLQARPATRVVVQHNYDNHSINHIMDSYNGLFDYMVCLDTEAPVSDARVFTMPRAIIPRTFTEVPVTEEVRIGSFGFALPHKNFPLIMREINRCFDNAVFNLHMTEGAFTGGPHSENIIAQCNAEITKPGIRLNHTSEYLTEEQVVEYLSNNHINALFYNISMPDHGLSSVVDYMIAAQRPMLLTNCPVFKHVLDDVTIFPTFTFTEILSNYETSSANACNLYRKNVNKLTTATEKMLTSIGILPNV